MGCKTANGTKCCFECNKEYCYERCEGMAKKGNKCDFYIDEEYECFLLEE